MNSVMTVIDLKKSYQDTAGTTIEVLRGISFDVHEGEVVAITGASGSGKSTLLHAISGLDTFDSGSVRIAGEDLSTLSARQKDSLRNRTMGFIYQFHHLLPEFSALENVAMPLMIGRMSQSERLEKARRALSSVGLAERLEHLPSQLSGGERQRTAIARAIVTKPRLILADEPTGNLDRETAAGVFDLFLALAKSERTAVVLVTHDTELASRCDRILHLAQGQILAEDATH